MPLSRKKLLSAFLEKDNVKLVAYEGKNRIFAGQITFSGEVIKDAFIADPVKFSSQIKIAFAQKPVLKEVSDVVLFLPPDKTFTKTMDQGDSIDGFIQSLPYFKEELLINNQETRGKKQTDRVTCVAFEKKLVEDLQRPFLESGKTIVAVRSLVNDLVSAWPASGQYLLLTALDKEVVFAVADDGALREASSFKTDLFVSRFGEYAINHNLKEVKDAFLLGVFPVELAEKLRQAEGLNLSSLSGGDIYDLAVFSYLKLCSSWLAGFLGKIDLSGIGQKLPRGKRVFLVGAVVAGVLLVSIVAKSFDKGGVKKTEVVSPVAVVPVQTQPEAKPADFKVRILNGTLIEGEAGRLADKIKAEGFAVSETKNATTAGFVATRLRITKDVPDKITATVKAILDKVYESTNVEGLASGSAGVKIEIIIGKKK